MFNHLLKSLMICSVVLLFVSGCEEPDTTAPKVTVTYPPTGTAVSEIVNIICEATDNVEVKKVELWIDGVFTGLEDITEPYSFVWNTVLYPDDSTFALTVAAYDVDGNIGYSVPIAVIVNQSTARPIPVDILRVDYDTEMITIAWELSPDNDFDRYELFTGSTTESFEHLITFEDQNILTFTMTEFNPLIENYFRVTVYDTLGLNSTGDYLSNERHQSPNPVAVTEVDYTLSQMTIHWETYVADTTRIQNMLQKHGQSPSLLSGTDFVSYELLYSELEAGEKTSIATFSNIDINSFTLSEFDPTHENWFWVKVTDFWDLNSVGVGMTHPIDPSPTMPLLNPVREGDDALVITWSENSDWDFASYKVYESIDEDLNNNTLIYSSAVAADTSYTLLNPTMDENHYFQLIATDFWNQSVSSAIVPGIAYSRFSTTIGGSEYDFGYSLQQTIDGGYVIAGGTYSLGAGGSDLWLIKTDAAGSVIWDQVFGGAENDRGVSVQQTMDGGYVITGYTSSIGAGGADVWLIKTDASGNLIWDQVFGGTEYDWGESVQQTTDGGYIITGVTGSFGAGNDDLWLIKTDAGGNEEWNNTFGGNDNEKGKSVQQTTDGGYVITGSTEPPYGSGDVWLIKIDAAGNEVWNREFGGSSGDYGYSIQQTTDGGYIITGTTSSIGAGGADVWLIKTDANGNTVWTQTFGGSEADRGTSVQQTADDGFIVTGYTWSFGAGKGDIWLIKTDAAGNEVWSQIFGGADSDAGYSVQQTKGDGYIIAGTTYSFGNGYNDIWLIKTDPEGNVVLP